MAPRTTIEPLTPERWGDLEALFGERGACGGCWCMWWRLARSEFERRKGDGNREAFRRRVEAGPPPGLVAYRGGEPVGWCAVAPREEYAVLGRSPVLEPVDDTPVWSLTCFFIRRDLRRSGLSVALIEAAVRFARGAGARWLEGYPVVPRKDVAPDVFVFTGLPGAFEKCGFAEVARRSPTRPIYRRELGRERPARALTAAPS